MTLSYDQSADVLYIAFEKASPGTYVYTENQNGDILKLDRQSGKVIGITLPFFSKRSKAGKIIVPEVGLVPFNEITDLIFQ